ncbi:MAG TPA: tetraacyldisaccharide 4'-kinase, partial [Terriglobia bacterium]|nr:tetraacyldisaccharide 4'-kinase [Terriglobia bacterium]
MRIPFPLTLAAQAAATLYLAGAAARAGMYRTGWRRQRRLRARVVSIGNIAWGGTGKTPFTIWLAQRLAAAGARASILTRGYGRPAGQRVLVLSPGASADQARRCG